MNVGQFLNPRIEFDLSESGLLLEAKQGEELVLDCRYADGEIDFSVRNIGWPERMHLRAKAKVGDAVKVVLLTYRIELYINGALEDEEWPAGAIFDGEAELTGSVECVVSEAEIQKQPEECVLGTLRNVEGWRPGGGVFVGDCMPYSDGKRYHVLYLKDRHHHQSKFRLGAHQWEHLSTDDLVNWQIHPMAVEITDTEEGSICTGSWIKKGDAEYLYYTVRIGRGRPAPLKRSVSTDGYHFAKDEKFSFTISEKYTQASARDPKVILGADGKYHMFLTSMLALEKKGCLVHLVSEDLDNWTEMDEPIFVADLPGEPECSDYFELNGWYYLVYSLHGGKYLYSDKPFSDWRVPEEQGIPCESVPKMAIWNGRILFAGFKRSPDGYAGTLTFMEAYQKENGELAYKTVEEMR